MSWLIFARLLNKLRDGVQRKESWVTEHHKSNLDEVIDGYTYLHLFDYAVFSNSIARNFALDAEPPSERPGPRRNTGAGHLSPPKKKFNQIYQLSKIFSSSNLISDKSGPLKTSSLWGNTQYPTSPPFRRACLDAVIDTRLG